jgi:hypothetical protein
MSTVVLTPVGRLSYPNLFKPRLNKLKKREEYSCVILFNKGTDIKVLTDAAEEAMIEVFGADKNKWPKDPVTGKHNYNHPFKDQAKATKDGVLPAGYEAGAVMLNLSSKDKPGVVKQVGPGKTDTILDPADIYAGCYVVAQVSFYAYDHESGQKGVNCSLTNIMKVKDGDSLSGRPSAESAFKAVATAPEQGAAPTADGLFNPMS